MRLFWPRGPAGSGGWGSAAARVWGGSGDTWDTETFKIQGSFICHMHSFHWQLNYVPAHTKESSFSFYQEFPNNFIKKCRWEKWRVCCIIFTDSSKACSDTFLLFLLIITWFDKVLWTLHACFMRNKATKDGWNFCSIKTKSIISNKMIPNQAEHPPAGNSEIILQGLK